MGDAINDAMNLILPVLQEKHATIIKEAGRIPLPPSLLNAVRKLGGKLSLSITDKESTPSSYMQQIAWGISDINEMCALAFLAVSLLPKGLMLVVDNNVRGVQLWTDEDGADVLNVVPVEFGGPLSAKAGK